VAINSRIYECMMLCWRGEPGDLRRAHGIAAQVMKQSEKHAAMQTNALFCLARVQLGRLQLRDALEAAREAHRRLRDGPVEEWEELIRLTFIETLIAEGHDQEADEALWAAFEAVRQ